MKAFKYAHSDPNWHDHYGGFYFIHTWPIDDDGTLRSTDAVNNCREFFSMKYQEAIWDGRSKNASAKAYALLTTGKRATSRSVSSSRFTDQIKNAVILLNTFESHYKIPKTRVYPVVVKQFADKAFVIGSKRWTANRYSFGLWSMFLRLTQTSVFNGTAVKTLIPTMKWSEIYHRVVNSTGTLSTMRQARRVFPEIEKFFAFEREFLKYENRKENWNPKLIGTGMQRPEGIFKLVTGGSYSLAMRDNWLKFNKELKEKKENEKVQDAV